jgi:phosphate transport system substrate-binding protein
MATRKLFGTFSVGAILLLVASGVTLVGFGQSAGAVTKSTVSSFTKSTGTGAPSSASKEVLPSSEPAISMTGSSETAVAVQEWVGEIASIEDLNINWQVSSSVIGLNDFANQAVDAAASDLPYSSGQANSAPDFPYQYVPDVGTGLSFMYNLDGDDGQRITTLVLDANVIDKIFLGEITSWNNPAISAINPELAGELPSTKIVPVYRTDASSENYQLSAYLLNEDRSDFTAAQKAFQAGGNLGPGTPTATWPTPTPGVSYDQTTYPGWAKGNFVGQNGSDNAANYVSSLSSQGSVTYVEPAYAKEHAFPMASLLNAAGDAVQPTASNITIALKDAHLNADLTQNLTKVYSDIAPDAYPLSAYSYLVTPCSPALASAQGAACDGHGGSTFPKAKGFVLGKFIHLVACSGQKDMSELGYAPIPEDLVLADFRAIDRLTGANKPASPTAANCRNPTITGT